MIPIKRKSEEGLKQKKKSLWIRDYIIRSNLKRIKDCENSIMEARESSSSSLVFRHIINRFLDWAGWVAIAVFVYIWWTQRGMPITDCARITVDACNVCFGYAKELGKEAALNISKSGLGGIFR